ncbi:MAG: hypothetical protein HOP19_10615 [Acidobacteria bacterium]|nr:hypothetical protein [Acidobacteriota bacterium]
MGQYYKFINKTKDKESEIALPFNFGMPWAKSLEYDSEEELRKKFDYVIEHNQWDEADHVQAVGDYGATYDYPEER